MSKLVLVTILLASTCGVLLAQSAPQLAVPQTARQALMEMFFSKEPGTLFKHLPAATRATLEQSGAMTSLNQYSALAGQMHTRGATFQTFETGSVMFSSEDPKTGQKVEAVVDQDSLQGDLDDIELSFHTYKDKQPQRTPFMPRMVFAMKMESGLWTLNTISITINLPLADPDLLKSFANGMKAHATMAAATSPQMQPQIQGQTPTHTFGSDANALAAVRTIVAAEATYAATYPAVGYTCTLSDLDGFGAAEANEHQAMLISSGLASGKHQGYSFSLWGCTRAQPSPSFRLTAAPIGESYGRRLFCVDQSGVIHSSDDGSVANCLNHGTPVP
jgi:hypothetical protein